MSIFRVVYPIVLSIKPSTSMLAKNVMIKRNEELYLYSALNDKGVMMNLETGNYTGLNSVAADIWNCLDKAMTINDLAFKLKEIYKVDYDQCINDISGFVNRMHSKEMILVVA